MENMIDFAELLKKEIAPVQIPGGTLCAWVDCCDCVWGEYNPPQGAYWCCRYKEHPSQQGCSRGIER